MSEPVNKVASEVLFYEQGASWAWLLLGPFAGIGMAILQKTGGYGHDLWIPIVFLVLVSVFVAIQIKAARIHTSVELTAETLRQGAETIQVDEIVSIYPEASGSEVPKWQSARALGELSGVPRGRTGIGLKLTGARTAQAWARKHRRLREVLTPLVEERAS
ncbi:hypothetical protein [Mycolicibacterium fortuitum]|uniref:DUF3093 domain-containing protein n=4 Tax=Mycolicibacterium fortuitum TaxID=1766 RepID=A0AAE4VHE3_MYCFO|nr:hypothetical protein [Mycolicibacterium fortuitum]AIY48341.1 putative membrane protein [Mycobacterium sp. VKM Ac-1817D]AMD55815.1 hypothetical protein ATO49_24330 [Mycolicibacterium fortuitum subsp. fortuitum DSM 46621 = ATCC 6841 = JCM 6387]EJZ14612.1 transmembrane protein [Mycolicibacterium fortuitum subsp. fortuitum DSM 46621 = ATCC 6841 = JCM 6387]MBP3084847.1 DUF3093 domain-containing protein [Mycolicibacterium fortuitum]MCA4751337.1 DUF3093 domain-containing protein [Mycolicibacterium